MEPEQEADGADRANGQAECEQKISNESHGRRLSRYSYRHETDSVSSRFARARPVKLPLLAVELPREWRTQGAQ
jgi:hypothetical protein